MKISLALIILNSILFEKYIKQKSFILIIVFFMED